MKDIKEFLPFYLGCDATVFSELFDEPLRIEITLQNLLKWGTNIFQIKPHLRPLSDMTDGELLEIFKIVSLTDLSDCDFEFGDGDEKWVNAIYNGYVADSISYSGDTLMCMNNNGTFSPLNPQSTSFQYLLKQGFDLFNLIPEGLAIDKTKIK